MKIINDLFYFCADILKLEFSTELFNTINILLSDSEYKSSVLNKENISIVSALAVYKALKERNEIEIIIPATKREFKYIIQSDIKNILEIIKADYKFNNLSTFKVLNSEISVSYNLRSCAVVVIDLTGNYCYKNYVLEYIEMKCI